MENKSSLEEEIRALEERVAKLRGTLPRQSGFDHTGGAPRTEGSNLSLVFSVIAGAFIVGAAIIYSRGAGFPAGNKPLAQVGGQNEQTGMEYIAPLSADDYMRGGADAEITLVEFSDSECPFCKQFHGTLNQIVAEYGGRVAWVYRHFPLEGLHPKAPREAEAIECAGELGGNEGFWRYLDRLFEITPANNGLDLAELPRIAEFIGLDSARFETCLSSGKYAARVADNARDARKSGGTGTPYTVILDKSGKPVDVLEGALPYYSVKIAIEEILRS